MADFSEFVKQEDTLPDQFTYDHQNQLQTKAPNPLRSSPKNKTNLPFTNIQTPLQGMVQRQVPVLTCQDKPSLQTSPKKETEDDISRDVAVTGKFLPFTYTYHSI